MLKSYNHLVQENQSRGSEHNVVNIQAEVHGVTATLVDELSDLVSLNPKERRRASKK